MCVSASRGRAHTTNPDTTSSAIVITDGALTLTSILHPEAGAGAEEKKRPKGQGLGRSCEGKRREPVVLVDAKSLSAFWGSRCRYNNFSLGFFTCLCTQSPDRSRCCGHVSPRPLLPQAATSRRMLHNGAAVILYVHPP